MKAMVRGTLFYTVLVVATFVMIVVTSYVSNPAIPRENKIEDEIKYHTQSITVDQKLESIERYVQNQKK